MSELQKKKSTEKRKRTVGPLLILLAACFWGSMGIFVRGLTDAFGFSPIQIVTIRLTAAAAIFCLLLLVKDRSGFRIALRDLPLFFGLAFGSVLLFTVCYFSAITMMPLSAAAILLYTSPIWIMLMSVLFFHEKLSGRKLLALALAFAGCVLVSGVSGEGITLTGLLFGLGSRIGYGLYSILGTVALRRYSPYTVTAYTFLFASVGACLICRPADMIAKFARADYTPQAVLLCCLTPIVTAVIPFLLYTLGLRTVEASRAGILATLEPVVATVIGVLCFSETPTLRAGLGILLVLSAVVLLNWRAQLSAPADTDPANGCPEPPSGCEEGRSED